MARGLSVCLQKGVHHLLEEFLRTLPARMPRSMSVERLDDEEGHEATTCRSVRSRVSRKALQRRHVQGQLRRQAICHWHRSQPHDGPVAGVIVRGSVGPRHGGLHR
eukprot:SRR837773.12767.p5 GENE.SRR837773.12767~~SRR837773.12767.p5  ORF type:complete len:106 (+),score=1.66 SRR837773.12767:754-1071(+)